MRSKVFLEYFDSNSIQLDLVYCLLILLEIKYQLIYSTDPKIIHSDLLLDDVKSEKPQIQTDNNGNWLVVWQGKKVKGEDTDYEIIISFSTDNAYSWSSPTAITNNNIDDFLPKIETDEKGTWVVTWTAQNGDKDILYSVSHNNGQSWTSEKLINSHGNSDSSIDTESDIITDAKGTWLVVWSSTENINNQIGNDSDILFARSVDNGENWSQATMLNISALNDSSFDHDKLPSIASDKNGNWIAVWQSSHDLNEQLGSDEDILYSISNDEGISWQPPLPIDNFSQNDNSKDLNPKISSDKSENWIVVWEKDNILGKSDEVVSVISNNLGITWSNPASISKNNEQENDMYRNPYLVSGERGNWLITWESDVEINGEAGNDFDIFYSMQCFTNGLNSDFDTDFDEIPNSKEIAIGSDPCNADSDDDGFKDGLEIYINSDPLDPCSDNPGEVAYPPDINNDGVVDLANDILGVILKNGTNDPRYDLDGDGTVSTIDTQKVISLYHPMKCTQRTYQYWIHVNYQFENGCCLEENPVTTSRAKNIFTLAQRPHPDGYEAIVCTPDCASGGMLWRAPANFLPNEQGGQITLFSEGL